ncbi:hypothetical protein [Streptomyces lycii]|uniref:hypothetical protein n=1 Tax=Streptomyces lycii TaxID=2654337 RepID=UPI001F294855|nr:hypothetical protein [Streptomyces lycii]
MATLTLTVVVTVLAAIAVAVVTAPPRAAPHVTVRRPGRLARVRPVRRADAPPRRRPPTRPPSSRPPPDRPLDAVGGTGRAHDPAALRGRRGLRSRRRLGRRRGG